MKKPKFLQRFQFNQSQRKMRKLKESNKYRIAALEERLNSQNSTIRDLKKTLTDIELERKRKLAKAFQEELDRTDPFKADHWKVVYNTEGKVSTVYFNDQELYGVQRFDVDFDSEMEGQTPRFTLESYGSIEIVTESE